MSKFRTSLLAGAALLIAGFSSASAADLNGGYSGGSMKDGAYMPSIAAQPSWYVRVDGSYSSYDTPAMTENGVYDLTEASIGSSWGVGAGVGRYFTSNIRGELTYDYRAEADVQGTLANGHPVPGIRRFGLRSDLLLASLYYDFDTGSRFRPYIGVGIGTVRHKTTDGTVENCGCVVGTIDGASKWSTAAALMAGFSMQVRDRLHIDAGYRFLYLGEATTGAVNAVTAGGPTVVSDDPDVSEIHAHEFRVGLRYDIN